VIRAFETSSRQQDVLEFVSQHNLECIDHAEAQQANAAILKSNNVGKDRRL